jgi:transketolase
LHYVRFKDEQEKMIWEEVLQNMDTEIEERQRNVAFQAKEKPNGNVLLIISDDTNKKRPAVDLLEKQLHFKKRCEGLAAGTRASNVESLPTKTSIEMVTRPHRTNLLQWAKRHPKALILTADLTSSCEADLLRDKLPSQYLSMGMAEQNMMSFAGGLAREGYHPYIHTFAVFVTRRPFDQVAMSIGVPNLPVRLLGFLPGLTTPGGVTHQAIDDVTLMRAIPNMRILEVGDATEVQSVLDVAELVPGPVYIRMWRGQVPRLFPKSAPMKFGVVRKLSDGKDIVLITCGLCTEEALKIRSELEQAGVSFHHLHLSTIVPFPVHDVMEAAKATKYGIITMENHSIVGGIGSATAEALAENGIGKNLVRLGVPGVYAHGASCAYLMKEYGYDCTALQQAVEQLVGKRISGRNSFVARVETKKELPVAERPEDL